MRSKFIQFWMLALVVTLPPSARASGTGRKLLVELAGGYTYSSFAGIEGAEFSSIQHAALDFSIKYKTQNVTYGVGYFYTPQVNLKDVRWSDGDTGDYKIDLTTPYLAVGPNFKDYGMDFLLGFETVKISGTPELGLKETGSLLIGFEVSRFIKPQGFKRLSFPISGRLWMKPKRDLEFEFKPAENSTASAGVGFDLMVGVACELF